jgi:hypothetical protein
LTRQPRRRLSGGLQFSLFPSRWCQVGRTALAVIKHLPRTAECPCHSGTKLTSRTTLEFRCPR